ncbi:MAG TPA: hypothetical protein VLL82_15540 [Mycobacterium sp.]|nr:hypothetical protein [Mycobacterium sp.]
MTFLLTDLEGSTRWWEQDPKAMKAAMVRHDELLEKTIAAHNGFVFARMGDGIAAHRSRLPAQRLVGARSKLTDQGWQLSAEASERIRVAGDAAEGPRAFAEKRPAIWKGR